MAGMLVMFDESQRETYAELLAGSHCDDDEHGGGAAGAGGAANAGPLSDCLSDCEMSLILQSTGLERTYLLNQESWICRGVAAGDLPPPGHGSFQGLGAHAYAYALQHGGILMGTNLHEQLSGARLLGRK